MSNETKQQEIEDIKADVSDLEQEAINTRKLQAVGVIAFAMVILILLFFSFFHKSKGDDEKDIKETQIGTRIEQRDLTLKQDQKTLKELALEQQQTMQQAFSQQQDNNPFTAPKTKFKAKIVKGNSVMMIQTQTQASGANLDETPPDILSGDYVFDDNGKLSQKSSDSIIGSNENIEDKDYIGEVFYPKSASVGKFNPNLYLAKGTYIGCSLNTKLVSTIKGGISCTISEDVYSENGVTLLIEKGSKITGSYRSGQIKDGTDRIFVVWQEIKTPNNVIIPVSSGASDELGSAGIPGYVDNHWLQRFGAAILLSVIDDATNVALNGGKGTRSNSNYDYTENSREATREMSKMALEKFINIEPTLYKNQGDIVGVYVNRDIDFSSVYKLKVRKGAIRK